MHLMDVLPSRGTWTGLERGADRNLMKNKGKCQVLLVGRYNPRHAQAGKQQRTWGVSG